MDGVAFALVLLLWLVLVASWLVGVVDALSRPAEAFKAAGRSKARWIVGLAIGGGIAGVVYLLSVRPELKRHPSAGSPPAQQRERVPWRTKDWGDPFGR